MQKVLRESLPLAWQTTEAVEDELLRRLKNASEQGHYRHVRDWKNSRFVRQLFEGLGPDCLRHVPKGNRRRFVQDLIAIWRERQPCTTKTVFST